MNRPPKAAADKVYAMFGKAHASRYPAKTIIYSERDSPTHIFLVEEGSAVLTKSSVDGKEMILAYRTRNSIIGTEAAILGRQHTTSLMTVSPSRIRALPSALFRQALSEDGDCCRSLLWEHCMAIEELRNRVSGLVFDTPRERLEDFFYDLFSGTHEPGTTRLPLTQGELGRYVNVSRQRLNGLLRELEKDGVVRRLNGSYFIDRASCRLRDSERLSG